ncbi:MAG TPA: proline iminopeptidase-family hydrolase [Candidatus Polarisedimenticolaceae bacterium]|nr:proline iminopeptidase-family hydrolase [Candidatus Polarisedimenticolaceae bacterium]
MHRALNRIAVAAGLVSLLSCSGSSRPQATAETTASPPSGYFDNTGRDDVLSGGAKLIPITTPKGTFHVWTKRVGNNPRIKVLLLHGGPGFTHEYLESFDSHFPGAGFEYYYYDQLGSFFSDQPDEPSLWDLPRFVDEVEQVRTALKLDRDSFYLYGHSWGGLLALEYALSHQDHLKGLIVSNMVSSIPRYNAYAEKVFKTTMDPAVLAEIRQFEATGTTDDPRYMGLLIPHHYEKHVIRMPYGSWPEPVQRVFKHMNPKVYVPMQGPSELGASGKLAHWDRSGDLGKITVPTLTIGAAHDTMDPEQMNWMSAQVKRGRFLYCPEGSHLAQYDDPGHYFPGLIQFIRDVDAGTF